MLKIRKISYLFFLAFITSAISFGQCAMCRAQLESMEDNSMAEGVNDGIVFLMLAPYVLLAIVGYAIYRNFSKAKQLKE